MLNSFYPVILSNNIKLTGNFIKKYFNFKETFVSDWYISLKHENNFEIAIIDKNHETIPERFRQQSKGIILNFEVEDVDKIYERISEDKNMNILLEIQNEEWGQRHFIFHFTTCKAVILKSIFVIVVIVNTYSIVIYSVFYIFSTFFRIQFFP